MKPKPILIIAGLLILAMAAFLWWRVRPGVGAIDLVELFPEAEKRTLLPSLPAAFDIQPAATIAGESKRGIFAHPDSRIIWRVQIPERAELRTFAALHEYAWTQLGDGVRFRVGISDKKNFEDLAIVHVDPYGRPEDRRWVPITVDLSKWAGQNVEVIFNTEAGPNKNSANDAAVWGEPVILQRP